MTNYEELLDQVRELTNETILLQEQLSSDLQEGVEPADVNHNLALIQNYERPESPLLPLATPLALELGDSVIKPCKRPPSLLEPSQTSLPFEKYTQTLPARLSGSLGSFKIPPGDPTSRLIAWRNKNRHLFAQQDSQQQQQHNLSGPAGLSPLERRRPLSLHGPREELLFGSGFAHSASLHQFNKDYQQPLSMLGAGSDAGGVSSCTSTASSSPRPTRLLGNASSSGDNSPERRDERVTEPFPRCYELDGSSTEDDSRPNSSLQSQRVPTTPGTWPVKRDLWVSNQPAGLPAQPTGSTTHNDLTSVMSFASSAGISPSSGMQGQRRLSAKMDVVYSLLSMLGSTEGREDMSATLLSMSNSVDSCLVMRQSGCLPLLIQLIHAPGQDPETRERASRALYNIVHAKNDEKSSRREVRVLRLLEQLRDYCQSLRSSLDTKQTPDDLERHPGTTIAALMKLSFDESHRHAMCQLGGLHAVSELIEMDHAAHGSDSDDQNCITLRRYAGMALTNLTFGDGNNKALLCSFRDFMKALVSQLRSPNDDLRQVTASVLRNLSWRADSSSKQTLREVGAVIGLMKAAMEGRKESTLKSILSALWNLSAHCSTNKMDICAVEGALAFLVDMLSYNAPSKTLAIVENAGGILRNVSSHIAVRDDYRAIVRERGCLQVLLRQLRSPSLTVVSNACGALWNLSARCPQDQRMLWDLGAVPMLRSLIHSKHRMISMGSSAALKNLLSARPSGSNIVQLDSTARGLGLPSLPSLMARRQKALEQEIDQDLAETCENIEPSNSPVNKEEKFSFKLDQSFLNTPSRSNKPFNQGQFNSSLGNQPGPSGLKLSGFTRSESKESMRSVTSTQSDTIFEKVNRQARNNMSSSELQMKQQSASMHSAVNFENPRNSVPGYSKGLSEKKYTLRYMNAIPERLKPGEPLPDLRGLKYAPSTMSWASAPSQDASCSKGLLHSSIEDTLSMTTSCESTNSKTGKDSDSGTGNLSASRAKSTSPFNFSANLPLKNIQKIMSPIGDYPFDLDQPTDYSLKYAEHTYDDDKQSSAYFTSTEHEQDTVKTYCTEGTPYQGSLNSSRASSASDIHEETRARAHFRKISDSQKILPNASKHLNLNAITAQNVKQESQFNRISSKMDSLRSTTNSESTITLEHGRSLESDSAIFEGDHMLGESSGVPSLSSLVEDEPKIIDYSKEIKLSSIQYEADTESFPESMGNEEESKQNPRQRRSLRRNSFDEECHAENNLMRYKTNTSLNDIETQDLNEHIISGNQPTPLTSLESVDQQQLQEDGDFSEMTYTNDYYTVQETYTINKDVQISGQKTFLSDDCSLSQQVSETLTYMSIDDRDTRSNIAKNDVDATETLTENMQTAASNSESCDSFDSIERSEQALLELCIKSGISNPETVLSIVSNPASKSRTSEDATDSSKQTIVSANDSNICKTIQVGEFIGKNQEEYRRQRDPDAMIASLDRLTATLVQQTEAMRERDLSAMKASLLSDTWNEDSPNEVSFPSISVSAPLVASFKSDVQEDHAAASTELTEDCSIPPSMTESKIIEIEAIKLAEAVSAEANQLSLASLDLDAINPPSTMGSLLSLTASIGGVTENGDISGDRSRCHSTSLPPMQLSNGRKKSLPIGLLARRALGNAQNHTGSLENLLNECNSANVSQLENVKPPSIMDELLDVGDMENSMLSVASITSEIADAKDNDSNSLSNSDVVFDLIKPVANVLSMTCMKYAETMQGSANNSLSECLENINPPSLFNEVSQMDDPTLEANTHCSDTLCIDGDLCSEEATHCVFDERIEEIANDTDDGATPISSEYCSSVESTPKRRFNKNHQGHLTPKQKRQLTKERYKTYTIAAERVKKEQEERKKQEQLNEDNTKNLVGKSSPFSKLTPKQRRQEDRARFQTQVLESPTTINKTEANDIQENEAAKTPTTEKQPVVKSGIPMLRKFGSGCKTFKVNRNSEEINKEKCRLRMFNDEGASSEHYEEYESSTVCSDEMQNLIEKNANIILNSDTEIKKLSPVCNENGVNMISVQSKLEQSMQIRFMNGVSKKLSSVTNEQAAQVFVYETTNENLILEDQDDLDESQSESDRDSSEKEEKQKIKGPRIVKPGTLSRDESVESNATDKSETEVPKGIRGRRKPLYSMPNTRKSTPQTSPFKQATTVSRSNTTPIVRATRATTLRQNNSFQKTNTPSKIHANTNVTGVNANAAKRSSIPQKFSSATFTKANKRLSTPSSSSDNALKGEPLIKPLERQGTFTKDEPEMENAPTVAPSAACKGNSAKPVNSISKITPPKLSPVHKSKLSLRTPQRLNPTKLTKTTSAEKISTPTSIPTIAKRSSTNLCGPVVKSSSNYQLAPTNESGIPRKISLGQRSNSNSSIVSNASTQGPRTKMVKEATSKIASLWKKVEESKSKQRYEKPDTRQWITPNLGTTQVNSPTEDKEQNSRLFRSSTFEGVTQDSEIEKQCFMSPSEKVTTV